MNKEMFISNLRQLGVNEALILIFIKLSIKIATKYENKFNMGFFKNVDFNSLERVKDMRLINGDLTLNKEEEKYGWFANFYNLAIDEKSYIKVDLKDNVYEIVLDNIKRSLAKKVKLKEILAFLEKNNKKFPLEQYKQEKKRLYITSLIYKHALYILKMRASNDFELMRIGMFENAYFEILNLNSNVLSENKKR